MNLGWRRAAFALPVVLATASASPLFASRFAAPEIIVAHGGPLKQRVVLPDFAENHRLMLATDEITRVDSKSLAERPRIRLAMYWGVEWRGRLDLPDSIGPMAAANGAQAGAFYPAFHGQPPFVVFGPYGAMPTSVRRITREGLQILAAHKIPTSAK